MDINQYLAINKALSDPNRIRIVMMLQKRDLCVCQITEVLGLATSTVSKHLSQLQQAGLIQTRKDGRWVHCCAPCESDCNPMVRRALQALGESLGDDAQMSDDSDEVKRVIAIPREELTRSQSQRLA